VDGRFDLGPDASDGVHPRWTGRGAAPERPSSYRYLLDLDLDLADEFDLRMRLVARPAVTAVTCEVGAGELDLAGPLAQPAELGVLVLEGVVVVSVRVCDRVAAELVGAGDLLQGAGGEDDDLLGLGCDVGWRALVPTRLALLDGAFAERIRPWPQITRALLHRTARRTRNLQMQRAIASQPRLEVRLTLLLWHLAGRWGKVEPGGIRVPLPLTHQLLGRLIGAERPSVSHALGRLSHAGLVTGRSDAWLLHGALQSQLASLGEPAGGRADRLAATIVSARGG
jgi:CRP/FNR family transcriptional regulator, cyclic AMP receptor protein